MAEALRQNNKLLDGAKQEEEIIEKAEEIIAQGAMEARPADISGKLIVMEEIAEGHVRWPALKLYFFSMGGWLFWTTVLLADAAADALDAVQVWYLGAWARQYELNPSTEVPVFR